ncbi:hypothetical protein G6F59_018519 [Rhizopus arrhizus]|nr:hypothetical protein G6F59_018519 [Rhizopus arrhizus]
MRYLASRSYTVPPSVDGWAAKAPRTAQDHTRAPTIHMMCGGLIVASRALLNTTAIPTTSSTAALRTQPKPPTTRLVMMPPMLREPQGLPPRP